MIRLPGKYIILRKKQDISLTKKCSNSRTSAVARLSREEVVNDKSWELHLIAPGLRRSGVPAAVDAHMRDGDSSIREAIA